jgi:hypothetical protein
VPRVFLLSLSHVPSFQCGFYILRTLLRVPFFPYTHHQDVTLPRVLNGSDGLQIWRVKSEKVKLSLCFNWALRHVDVLGEWRYSSTHSSTSVLDGGEWSASRPSHFTPWKEPLVAVGRLGGPQSRSGHGGEEKNSQLWMYWISSRGQPTRDGPPAWVLGERITNADRKILRMLWKIIQGPKELVLYGCETWSLTLRKEHRLRVFENRVLRRIF